MNYKQYKTQIIQAAIIISIIITTAVLTVYFQKSINETDSITSSNNAISTQNTVNSNLTEEEISGLIYMREEEKLAYDVYITLYEKWGIKQFSNIAKSEDRHTNSVANLLDQFGIIDPVITGEIGKYSNPDLEELYNALVEQGSESEAKALEVGATIEDLDIYDLNKYISQTKNADILRVYQNLKNGSENHIRAFTNSLENYDITYEPQYISEKEYQQILSSSNSQKRGNRH